MEVKDFIAALPSSFFAGVPDSQLRPFCDHLMREYGIDPHHHIIAANEGNCVGIAAGYHLATKKIPVVYMQNSGEGNIVNPFTSLLSPDVYAIPMIFVIGWRGEPGIKDEPQHVQQGRITLDLLDLLGIRYAIVDKDLSAENLQNIMLSFKGYLASGHSIALVIKKGALSSNSTKVDYSNQFDMTREAAIKTIVSMAAECPIVSTTGKASRELFEIRKMNGQDHSHDFLSVGSMGHASSIALGVAAAREDMRVICLDGDGAALMHMGSMAVLGASGLKNVLHVILNNNAHETVGGMPTVSAKIDYGGIALACGYDSVFSVRNEKQLEDALNSSMNGKGLVLIDVKCRLGSRPDLGRPTTTPIQNKDAFMAIFD